MESAVQRLAVVVFLVIGLSHILQPRVWVDFFVMLRAKGEAGVFVTGFLSLTFGALVVGFHNVWTGIPVVLTLMGWAQVVKATIYFCFPKVGMRSLSLVSPDAAWKFRVPGVPFVALGLLLGWSLIARS